MIPVEELRIGNCIYDDYNEIHKIERIESQNYNYLNGGDPNLTVFSKINDEYPNMYTCDIISGVPLTPEILEKCGFDKRHWANEWYYKKLRFSYENNEISTFVRFHYSGKTTYIKYLHQLQNLVFAILQEELTINL